MAGVKGRSGGHNAKAVKDLERIGTFRGDRHAGIENPDAPEGVPTPPKELEGEALAEWDRMIVRLKARSTLSSIDDAALYQYCCMFAETEELRTTQIETRGSIDILEENLHGIEKSDLVAAFQEITKLRALEASYSTKIRQGRMGLKAWLVEFGLTPASRSRVKLPEKKPQADPNKLRFFGPKPA